MASAEHLRGTGGQVQVAPFPVDPTVMADDLKLYTVAEVCWMFQVSKTTLYRWEATGRLTGLRTPGGHRRYRSEDLDVLLEQLDDH